MIDVWLVARDRGWRFGSLLLAYPNPYPKAGDLGRRWHGHAIFPALLATTRHIEVRSNWKIYLEEFAHAVEISMGQSRPLQRLEIDEPLSPFEAKYASSGHDLWRCCCDLGAKGENDTAAEAMRTP